MLTATLLIAVAQAIHVAWERRQQAAAMEEWDRLFGDS